MSKGRRRRSYRDGVAYTRVMPLDMAVLSAATRVFDVEKVGATIVFASWVWSQQEHLPDQYEDTTEGFRAGLWSCMGSRMIRKHYKPDVLAAVRQICSVRATIAQGERAKIFKKSDGTCFHCGGEVHPEKFHVDHLLPVAKGGLTHLSNLVVACPSCNLSKGAKV